MKFLLLAVGKPKNRELDTLYRDYVNRIGRLGIECGSADVKEVPAGGRFTDAHCMEREAARLLERLPSKSVVIALDRKGRLLSSIELAEQFEGWASRNVVFVLGGPLGLHDSILRRANRVISLSRMTFPHELARLVLAEQLYRAATIIKRVPYHK